MIWKYPSGILSGDAKAEWSGVSEGVFFDGTDAAGGSDGWMGGWYSALLLARVEPG